MWPDEVVAIYLICHPEKEKARYERLLSHLQDVGVPPDRIRSAPHTWGTELTLTDIFRSYDPFLKRGDMPALTFKSAGLSRAEISLALNLSSAIRDAVACDANSRDANSRDANGIVITLESDVWLRRDFVPCLCDLLADLRTKGHWDYVSLSEGCNTRPPGAPTSYYAPTKAYPPPHSWPFRTTDAMMFSIDYLKKLSKTFPPFKEIIDWEMNVQLMINRGTAFWADPPVAEQGSWNGRVLSSLWT